MFFSRADVVFPVFVVNVSINGFGDIRYDSGICFRVFRRIFDEDGDGIAGAVRQDDESRIVGPGEDASFVAVARAGFVSDDGAGSRQWFRKQDEDYNELFLRRNEIKTRQCVYISRDVHGKILRIVNDIAGGEISVGGYVDTVLRQHLEQHKERINELYKKQREDLI